ncbi:glycosyltransferase involved in cell wall biosynthesis [Albidovulum inexpectatum]|uniref:Glycosyltransferase involved in cell wall biosynthesis n=1 Tax=Albidovulum inexpectatum TaxID=196587 RepID=A0A2S5JE39_9RHOB|nr:glycosyltransferase family 2 protein [Albidovulum inexpectatum]PPB79723.1 glycosyltransferase involved in cell wall biosynthesis [Albidovulum inexpectatum]
MPQDRQHAQRSAPHGTLAPAGQPPPVLSIVTAAYNEEDVLPAFLARLKSVLDDIGEPWEIICVNDGSTDQTREILTRVAHEDARIKVINLSRNFGKERALTAGIDHAMGQAVIPLDADLQDPPELIADFVRLWREGYDAVYAVRDERDKDSWIKRNTASAFYAAMNRLSNVEIPANAGDFRLMDRRLVDALGQMRERNRFMKGLFAWVGFRQTSVSYRRPGRPAGKTKFNYWKLWNFALDGITGYSTAPLRIAGYFGLLFALLSMCYGVFLIIRTIAFGTDVPGYASTMVAVIFMGGIQLFVLGIIGEYLGRLYSEAKQRPLYLIESRIGFDDPAPPPRGTGAQ